MAPKSSTSTAQCVFLWRRIFGSEAMCFNHRLLSYTTKRVSLPVSQDIRSLVLIRMVANRKRTLIKWLIKSPLSGSFRRFPSGISYTGQFKAY